MSQPLRILMIAPEASPFYKTGGMADVVSELVRALFARGQEVRLALPDYHPGEGAPQSPVVPPFPVPLDETQVQARARAGTMPESNPAPGAPAQGAGAPVFFVDAQDKPLFDRGGMYMLPDDADRFIFFCRAALELCKQLNWKPDIIHTHGWQTGFVPNWLKTIYAGDPFFQDTATVYTIHNLAYQGIFGQRVLQVAGLESYGFIVHPEAAPEINQVVDLMARGILFADAINAVSERYAREIQTPEYGEKLDVILRERSNRLRGILNGIDDRRYDPAADPALPARFTIETLAARAVNKAALQKEAGLEGNPRAPLVALISRLNDSKGLDLLADSIDHLLDLGIQFVVMGTGDSHYHQVLGNLARQYPGRVSTLFTFGEPLQNRILAGADILLMPSRVEPSGTTQMIAMRYGCVPVVRLTGGLADSVQDWDPVLKSGTGFGFGPYDRWALFAAVVRAVEAYRRPDEWQVIQRNGMSRDFSWNVSAGKYLDLYQFALAKKLESLSQQQALARERERTAAILAAVPERIRRLGELAYNLWWSWNPDAERLFQAIEPAQWDAMQHNPVALLRQVAPARLAALAADADFLAKFDRVMSELDAYMNNANTWYGASNPFAEGRTIAYFSAEYGLHESLPIYSGGLGVLAGDHCKEVSDLGVPLVAVGFLYPQGYFRQEIDAQGNQQALYEKLNLASTPAFPALDPQGREVIVSVELPGRAVYAKVWQIQVGRMPVFLMDTDVEQNRPGDRELSYRLYGGDRELRITQEFVLGIGGVRTLRALGLQPNAFHMNEGHSAFLGLELIREQVARGRSFAEALESVRSHSMFTTHTPVPAGNDVFTPDLVDKYFSSYWPRLGLTRDQFLDLGRQGDVFSMTVLAIKLSAQYNGVSKIHGSVSRAMWHFLWPEASVDAVPIGSITNGIHTATWLVPEFRDLYRQTLGPDWYAHVDEIPMWDKFKAASDADLWKVHQQSKQRMIEQVRRRTRERLERLGAPAVEIARVDQMLDPDALTIGFARRVPTYKRATLIFRDEERLKRLLSQPGRPVQLIFAGKSHPADEGGKALIRQIVNYTNQLGFQGRVFFVEEYDMDLASYLVSGCDVWLNNPQRPLEASGTSGQKAAANGVINASVSDGWWAEAFQETNGWQIGDPARRYESQERENEDDAQALYWVLETLIVPEFYNRGADGLPHAWLARMKESIRTVTPVFSTRRMVKEYVQRYIRAMVGERKPVAPGS